MRGADLEVEDEDEAGAAVVARVVVEDDGGDLKGATPSTTMNAMGESASAAGPGLKRLRDVTALP